MTEIDIFIVTRFQRCGTLSRTIISKPKHKSGGTSSPTGLIGLKCKAPWAASSKGMQDNPGAMSANWLCGYVAMWLCGYVAEFLTSFSILSHRCTSSRSVGFLYAAAQVCKIGRISIMSRRLLSVLNL